MRVCHSGVVIELTDRIQLAVAEVVAKQHNHIFPGNPGDLVGFRLRLGCGAVGGSIERNIIDQMHPAGIKPAGIERENKCDVCAGHALQRGVGGQVNGVGFHSIGRAGMIGVIDPELVGT